MTDAEKRAGRRYRLPTEAEWEYACRAGTATPFHFGDACNGREANVNGQNPFGTKTKGPYLGRTTTVGSYKPNAFGLFDMHGNVWEWCEDYYDKDFYSKRISDDPQNDNGEYHVYRGGGFAGIRKTLGGSSMPGIATAATRSHSAFPTGGVIGGVGFRVCCDADQ
jgi:formylglycine-generating enzyme required for sulfatase activity